MLSLFQSHPLKITQRMMNALPALTQQSQHTLHSLPPSLLAAHPSFFLLLYYKFVHLSLSLHSFLLLFLLLIAFLSFCGSFLLPLPMMDHLHLLCCFSFYHSSVGSFTHTVSNVHKPIAEQTQLEIINLNESEFIKMCYYSNSPWHISKCIILQHEKSSCSSLHKSIPPILTFKRWMQYGWCSVAYLMLGNPRTV